jgi:phosphopantetheinyl transferase (holo-ACP synthase)
MGVGVDIVHVLKIVSPVRRSDTQSERIQRVGNLIPFHHRASPIIKEPNPDPIVRVPESSKWDRFLAVRWAIREAAYRVLFLNYWKESVSKEPGAMMESWGLCSESSRTCGRVFRSRSR